MKYINLFENFNSKSDIDKICKKYNIQNYTVNSDGSIDVDGNVNLYKLNLIELPLKFNKVSGDFTCSNNQLTTLEGSPQSVGGNFHCSYNKLTTLEGAPQSVGGSFYCKNNQLTSLKYAPQSVGGSFDCYNNKLTTLEDAPETVGHGFYCSNNKLTTLEGCPQSVGGDFSCSYNELTTLEGPVYIKYDFYCNNNPIQSIWDLISTDNKWDYTIMDLFKDYNIFLNDNTIILDRLNSFLEDIGKPTVIHVKGYNII